MALIPFAVKRLIPPGANDPRIRPRIGILHVDAMNSHSLFDYFNGPSNGVESHGHVQLDGTLEQYRDTDWQADANHKANDFALSLETQGFGGGEWTDAQLATIKRFILWCHEEHGIPLRVVDSWDDARGGWGYHTLFGAPSPWTPVAKSCPGPRRKTQFHNIIVPWLDAGAPSQEDDMADQATQDQLDRIEKNTKRLINKIDNSAERQKAIKASLQEILDAPSATVDETNLRVRRVLALVDADILEEDA